MCLLIMFPCLIFVFLIGIISGQCFKVFEVLSLNYSKMLISRPILYMKNLEKLSSNERRLEFV